MQQPSPPKDETTAEGSEGVDNSSAERGNPLPPIDLPPVQDDFEVNSWGRRSLMLLDSNMGGDSPPESTTGASLGERSRLSLLSPPQGASIDDALLNGLPSRTASTRPNRGQVKKHQSTSTRASQGSGSLTEGSSGQLPQASVFPSLSSGSLGGSAAPTMAPASHSKGYEFYFRALEANFRLAQAQANQEGGDTDTVISPPVVPAAAVTFAVQKPPPPPMITEDSTKVLPQIPAPRASAASSKPSNKQTLKVEPSETATTSTAAAATMNTSTKRNRSPTTDHEDRGGGGGIKVRATKNEREQQRAQRIAELIDQIRVNIEDDGIQLEVRSKFHILSKCTEYLREALSAAQAKEKSIHSLRQELKELQQKLEAPHTEYDESVTSSLTSTSTNKADGVAGASRKRSIPRTVQNVDDPSKPGPLKKAAEVVSLNETNSGNGSGGSAQVSDGTTAKVTTSGSDSSHQRQSRSKSSETTSQEVRGREESPSDGSSVSGSADMEVSPGETGTIVSDAAVKSQIGSGNPLSNNTTSHTRDKESTNSDSSSDKEVPLNEVVALERSMALDYELVFLESNVPQLVAIPSGRIVAYNHAFLNVAGLRKAQVGRITLFSLIPLDDLTALFEVLAQTMGPGGAKDDVPSASNSNPLESSPTHSGTTESENKVQVSGKSQEQAPKRTYPAITLPCVEFPVKRKQHTYKSPYPLYVTITLLDDADAQKRCMHCVFSNHRGTSGKVGVLTPDLLQGIFTYHPKKDKMKRPDSIPGQRSHEERSQQQGMEVAFHSRNTDRVIPVFNNNEGQECTVDPVQSGSPNS